MKDLMLLDVVHKTFSIRTFFLRALSEPRTRTDHNEFHSKKDISLGKETCTKDCNFQKIISFIPTAR